MEFLEYKDKINKLKAEASSITSAEFNKKFNTIVDEVINDITKLKPLYEVQ